MSEATGLSPNPGASHITLHRVLLRQQTSTGNHAARCRARLAEAMQNLTPPSAMPPQAILIIRRLPDPRPGLLLNTEHGYGSRPVAEWSQGAEAQIASTWQRAIRAAHDPVPASADAVWFADPAEWLACLSWELHRGTALHHWWWQSWLSQNDVPPAARLFRLWQQHAQSLPQALTYLHAKEGAAIGPLLSQLSTTEAQAITTLVEAAYALATPMPNAPMRVPPVAATRLVATLPVVNGALLALCLGLVHSPLAVQQHYRRPTFAPIPAPPPSDPPPTSAPNDQAIIPRSLRRGIRLSASQRIPHPNPPQLGEGTGSPSATDTGHTVIPRSLRRGIPLSASQRKGNTDSSPARQPRAIADKQSQRKLIFLPPTKPRTNPAHHEITAPSPVWGGLGWGSESASQLPPPTPIEQDTDAARPIATNFGGIWLLVNLLAQLSWLETETTPALNSWHKFAALGRALAPELIDDPLWPLLNAQTKELASPAATRAWLATALPLVHAFLAAYLEETQEFIAALHDPALLHITPTHIDVVFDIEQIRMSLRLAGLDQNPGWTPQLGRVITLHYV